MSSFGKKVKKLRKEKGWSQDEFAEKIGVHGRHIGKYENGSTMPHSETVIKMAKVFDVSTDYLLLEEESLNPASKIKDKVLLKEFEIVDQMNDKDREVIKSLIDAFIKKGRIEQVLEK
ncbi:MULTISPECIES: helix-turn-helix domain-containing protein [Leptospira]|uniref:helix-turn-helix domain-containing protein n=1 Tax=Leptospira TaxID=171 RepID=UPI0002928638|nr:MULTISPECIES: helix-turn-helix transcriptional regulator [Leptospira]EKO87920.1 DNA-binding helix-turn-helix protein [Leptospira interrogans serovar Grippotyphosa str. Andaman]EKP84878.1 DNA-binding helix-turn-helix protein [Leptospira interrogans serovar Grippotyphosa str. 2006006986]EMN94366.1 DNA-binding helix-turn-helix protein [Leptospira interrogans serovar Medanensis str. UT053]EMO92576.1 DNA-binding helix-turn-helix protein [Leptospira interrogans str. UI 13372]KGE28016.1 DNA-bindin